MMQPHNSFVNHSVCEFEITVNIHFQGCQTLLEDYLEGSSTINGVIGIIIAVIEVILS